jgi:hypothetical protein
MSVPGFLSFRRCTTRARSHCVHRALATGARRRTARRPVSLEAVLRASSIDEADRRFVAAVREAAERISMAFEAAIARGDISEQRMFDFDYRPVTGTDPQQYDSPFTALCDAVLPPIQEPLLSFDPRVVFCAAVDSNAFLPTHNRKFSQPQRPNDRCGTRPIAATGVSSRTVPACAPLHPANLRPIHGLETWATGPW